MAKIDDVEFSQRIIDAFCVMYKRPDRIIDKAGEVISRNQIDNPVTKEEFTKNIIKSFIKEVVASYEGTLAAESARKIAIDRVKAEVNVE